jgi:urease subunit alpha
MLLSQRRNPCFIGGCSEAWGAIHATSVRFVSQAAHKAGIVDDLKLRSNVVQVRHCRQIGKKDLIHNQSTPKIEVDPETYEVRVDGALITCEPARILPLAQRYFLF